MLNIVNRANIFKLGLLKPRVNYVLTVCEKLTVTKHY